MQENKDFSGTSLLFYVCLFFLISWHFAIFRLECERDVGLIEQEMIMAYFGTLVTREVCKAENPSIEIPSD
jgi:hypothetical protein